MHSITLILSGFFIPIFIICPATAEKNIFCLNYVDDGLIYYNSGFAEMCTHVVFEYRDDPTYSLENSSKLETLKNVRAPEIKQKMFIYFRDSVEKIIVEKVMDIQLLSKNIVKFCIENDLNGVQILFFDHEDFLPFFFELHKEVKEKKLLLTLFVYNTVLKKLYDKIPNINIFVDYFAVEISVAGDHGRTSLVPDLPSVQYLLKTLYLMEILNYKIVYVLNTFGLQYELENKNLTHLGAPGYRFNSLMAFKETCWLYFSWVSFWDSDGSVPYASKDNRWISYDDARSIQIKVRYLIQHNIDNVMIDMMGDDIYGECNDGKYPLLHYLNEIMFDEWFKLTTTETPSTGEVTLTPKVFCKANTGYVIDLKDNNHFYYCIKFPNGTYQSRRFYCPRGVLFDEKLLKCTYAYIFGKAEP